MSALVDRALIEARGYHRSARDRSAQYQEHCFICRFARLFYENTSAVLVPWSTARHTSSLHLYTPPATISEEF